MLADVLIFTIGTDSKMRFALLLPNLFQILQPRIVIIYIQCQW